MLLTKRICNGPSNTEIKLSLQGINKEGGRFRTRKKLTVYARWVWGLYATYGWGDWRGGKTCVNDKRRSKFPHIGFRERKGGRRGGTQNGIP